jgi:hypothetical protein
MEYYGTKTDWLQFGYVAQAVISAGSLEIFAQRKNR